MEMLSADFKISDAAAHVAMLVQTEDISKFVCPAVICKLPEDDGETCDFDKPQNYRNCPQCKQQYHSVCRKANSAVCVTCGFNACREGQEDEDSEEEADDDV